MTSIARIVALAALVFTGVAAAKPLYLTVPRAYGSGEPVGVDVAFEGKGPVELRVLKPANTEAFIRAQGDLRRAYQTPPTLANPGNALSRGLIATRSPGSFLLFALDKDFRKGVAPDMPQRPREQQLRPLARVAEGPEKLVGVPTGFTAVRSQWLNLDLGGADREFNVPGFDTGGYSSGYQERRVTLAPLPTGLYIVQLVQGRVEGQVVLVVTDLTVQLKQTDGQVLVRVAGRDQQPRVGAQVQVYLPTGKGPAGTTDDKGEVVLAVQEPRLIATASCG